MKKEVICGVYKITNKISGDTYIGSSVNIYRRWRKHKCQSEHKKYPDKSLYKDMDKIGITNFELQILCKTDEQNLKQAEQNFIVQLKPKYNHNNAIGINFEKHKKYTQEWQKENKERYFKYQKQYQKNNKERIKQTKDIYEHRLCNFNNKICSFCALSKRFSRKGIQNPAEEAKKYLIKN